MRTWPASIQLLEEFPESSRFRYAKVSVDGQLLFLKQAKTEAAGKGFDNELAWAEFIESVSEANPQLAIRVPDPISHQPGVALLSEFIDAPLLTERLAVDDLHNVLDRYTDVLLAIDKMGVGYDTTLASRTDRISYRSLDKQWPSWFEGQSPEVMSRYEPQLARAQQIFTSMPTLTACMQMGDFVPWHVFKASSEWIIFDSEHAHHEWPRFYDLAYSYSRMYTHQRQYAVAEQLLSIFIQKLAMPEDEFWAQFLPVLTSRAVGVLSDALTDLPKVNYIPQAEELLAITLDNPKALMLY